MKPTQEACTGFGERVLAHWLGVCRIKVKRRSVERLALGLLLVIFVGPGRLSADLPPTDVPPGHEIPDVVATIGGPCFAVVIPPTKRRTEDGSVEKVEGVTRVLRATMNGDFEEVWTRRGLPQDLWMFLSTDGHYLVGVNSWLGGDGPAKENVALRIYKDGQLMFTYSPLDFLRDASKVRRGASHYMWLDEDPGRSPVLGPDDLFRFTTTDGCAHFVDVKSGKILSTQKSPAQ